MPSQPAAPATTDAPKLVRLLYRGRWIASGLLLAVIVSLFAYGATRVSDFSTDVASLADTSIGDDAVKPLFFDPSMDVWFGEADESVATYYDIERRFVAEDFVMVTFEATDDPLGVFSPQSLETIARLSEQFLTIPGVRHVRSLTVNPWIRWGWIEDDGGREEGLIISDLVEGPPRDLDEAGLVTRMVATLGARRAADRIGDDRVRAVLGPDARYEDHLGEPRLLGTIVDDTATTTAIQVQVLRPRIEPDAIERTFDDARSRQVGPNLSTIEQQRATLRGIEHFLRLEQGRAVPTPERLALEASIAALPDGPDKHARQLDLANPTQVYVRHDDGTLTRKWFEYDPVGDGWRDSTDPANPVDAPADFQPKPLSPFAYHLGGVPLFERNFEIVGLADGKYVPLMFLVIIVVLVVVFRRVSGVVACLAVVFGSILAMVGVTFTRGDLLNNLTMMSPNMLTAVGIADAIHLVASWALLRSRFDDKHALIVEVMRRNALPLFLTTLTTFVGFYSLTVSRLEPVKMLGAMVALGTVVAWTLSMTVVPALLSLLPHRRGAAKSVAPRMSRWFSEARAGAFVDVIIHRRRGILAITAVIVVVAGFGLTRVEVDSDFRGMFPDDNPTMSDFQWIEDRMGGVGDLELIFTGRGAGALEAPSEEAEARLNELSLRELGASAHPEEFTSLSHAEADELATLREAYRAWNDSRIGVSTDFLTTLDAFETRLRAEMADPDSQLAVLTDFISPLDTLRKIHQVQHENRADMYRVPNADDVPEAARASTLEYDEWTEEWSLTPPQDASTLVAQYYLQYENGARPGEALWTQLSADRTQFRVQGRVQQDSSATHLAAFQRIEEIARTEFPMLTAEGTAGGAGRGSSDFTISGKTLLFARTSDLFARGFVESMVLALAAITLLIGLLFRSWRYALISLVPNVLPIVVPLSVFGLLGVPLDGPAILVSSVALGVCVDDTIHFLTKYGRARRAGSSARDSLQHALAEAGAPLTLTTLVLMIGFATLLLSDFSPNFQMGALAVVMIALAWFADFIVTTALLSFGRDPTPTSTPS